MQFQFGRLYWKQEPILIPMLSLVQTVENCNITAASIWTIALKTRADSPPIAFSAKQSKAAI